MKRKDTFLEDGSLELLLDTVCNTFGGILFVSLLLVVLINTSVESSSARVESDTASAVHLVEAEARRDELTHRLARLRTAEVLQADVSDSLLNDDVVESAERLKEAEARHARQVEAKSSVVGAASRAQIEINELVVAAEKTRQELDTLKKKAAKARQELAESVTKRSRGATAPKQRRADNLASVDYCLKDGRLVGPIVDSAQNRNVREFTFPTEGEVTFVDPIPGRGIPVAVDGANIPQIRAKLAAVNSGSNSVALFIWEDSFDRFEPLRLAMEESGLAYEILHCTPRNRVYFTSEGRERWEQE